MGSQLSAGSKDFVVFEVHCSTSHHSLLFLKFNARLPITKRVNKVRNIAFYHIMLQNYVQYRVRSPKSQKYKNCFLSVCVKVLLRSTQKYCVIYPLSSCAPIASFLMSDIHINLSFLYEVI